jgi:hypothetical protein
MKLDRMSMEKFQAINLQTKRLLDLGNLRKLPTIEDFAPNSRHVKSLICFTSAE